MKAARYLGVVVTSVPLGIAFQLTASVEAGAATCAHGNPGHYTSSGCLIGSGISGTEGQWHNNNMYMSSADYAAGYHVNNEMWSYTTSNDTQWVEEGLRDGFDPSDPCNCVAYEAFWADFNTLGQEFRHTIVNTTPNGTNHVYEVQNVSGTNNWNVYYDYGLVGTSTNQTSNQVYQHQAGLEYVQVSGISPTGHADTFDNYLQVEVAGTWKNWSSESTWVDSPCGPNPNGYCLNGQEPAVSQFNDNKP